MKTIDEMLSLDLLSTQQHREIACWLRASRTPAATMAMPPQLWRAIESASLAMNIDADLIRAPLQVRTWPSPPRLSVRGALYSASLKCSHLAGSGPLLFPGDAPQISDLLDRAPQKLSAWPGNPRRTQTHSSRS